MRSGGPGFCAFDGVAQWMNGVLSPDASGELDAGVQLTNGGAAFVASGELVGEPLLKSDGP